MRDDIDEIVEKARQGNREALDELIRTIRTPMYNLSLRMLMYPADAEDAVQEILIKIITHLSDFRGKSRFTTWSYRVAVNHLLTMRTYRAKELNITFDYWEDEGRRTEPSFDYGALPEPAKTLLTEEVRIGCMQGMLQCLEEKTRIALVLGELFELSAREASEILGITEEAFRKRLSRGRIQIIEFMQKNCGLVHPENDCYCPKLVGPDIRDKWIDPNNLQFAGEQCQFRIHPDIHNRLKELDEISRVFHLFRTYPEYAAPESTIDLVRHLIDSGKYQILQH